MQIGKMKVLSKGEIKDLERRIEKNYGSKVNLRDFLVLVNKKNKIWLVNKEVLNLDLSKLRINALGLGFGKLKRNEKIHLTIEGSQIVGKNATKNLVILDEKNAIKFMQGASVKPKEKINCEYHNFVIVKRGKDILGSSLLLEDGLKNLIPKSRRLPF